jgi:hypothetical protein
MILTIEAATFSEDWDRYRLQNNNTWRKVEPEKLGIRGNDKAFELKERSKVAEICQREGVLLIEDETYYANTPSDFSRLVDDSLEFDEEDKEKNTDANIYPALHRFKRPRRFKRSELIKAIKNGTGNAPHLLAIDLQGKFRIMRNPENSAYENDLSYAVIHELNAIKNRSCEQLFLASVSAWRNHLIYKTLPIFLEDSDYEVNDLDSEQEVWESIDGMFKR